MNDEVRITLIQSATRIVEAFVSLELKELYMPDVSLYVAAKNYLIVEFSTLEEHIDKRKK